MHVAVKDRLAGNRADIDANIEPGDGRIAGEDVLPDRFEQIVDRALFICLEIEIAGDVAAGE
jgi:hypothetical protein